MLCAQYWGKGDKRTVEKVEGLGLRFALLIGLIFCLCSMLIPRWMMKLYTDDTELMFGFNEDNNDFYESPIQSIDDEDRNNGNDRIVVTIKIPTSKR